jgi:flagellar hook-associated protein 3 FlgL
MTRITDSQTYRLILDTIAYHRESIQKYSNEVSTGVKVFEPGDSKHSGTISRFRELMNRIEGHEQRLGPAEAQLQHQNNILKEANELAVRAKEIATQTANETNGTEVRYQMAAEVFELRDQLIGLANTTYQGRYIYGGTDDDDPPYDLVAPYDPPATGRASEHYAYDADPGSDGTKSIPITDDMTITVSTPGNQIFDNMVQALERLGRSLSGYSTNPAVGAPDGTGAAYVFPDDINQQTADIQNCIDLLTTAREEDIMPEEVSVAARLKRLQTAESILSLSKTAAQEALARLQDADIVTSATDLIAAQTALEASLAVTGKIMNQSLLNYL